jgi:trans-2,3-dihydro-3-hydroxyanthranilate isomerase
MNKIKKYRYITVDVFAEEPLQGNPLAVFPDASDINDADMQKIAKELNLSETTFVTSSTKKDCIANVRIFTPWNEMKFAGHPTIGTAYVLIKERIVDKQREFALEEKVGPVPVKIDPGKNPLIWLRTPEIFKGPVYDKDICAKVLGLETVDLFDIIPQMLSAGNPTLFIALKNKEAVDRAELKITEMKTLHKVYPDPFCVFVFTPADEGAYSRMFALEYGITEDPATGSSTGPLAFYMMKNKLIPAVSDTRFKSEQGVKMGRRSILHVHINGEFGCDGIFVGGNVIPVAEAVMKF